MTDDGKLTSYATPWAKQFRDDINSLKQFEGCDDMMREINGDFRHVFGVYADDFCAIDQECEEVSAEEIHKTYQCRCWTKEGEWCREFLETHKASIAREVRAQSLKDTRGLMLYVTTMTTSNVCSMCETAFFSNLAKARVHVVQAFRIERCFVKRYARAHDWEVKAETEASFSCPDSECSFFYETNLLRKHIKMERLSKLSPRHKHIRADSANNGIPQELKQLKELKVSTENVRQRELCVSRRITTEGGQEQRCPSERRTTKAPKGWRRRSCGGGSGGLGASGAREANYTTRQARTRS